MNTLCEVLVYFSMVLMVNLIFAFCSVKVPPTRAKSPKFTSSRRKSCSDTPQTPEGKNTNATSTRSHRHSIGTSKDANRVQCSPKSGVATKTRSVKPELKAVWRAWSSQVLRLSLYKPNCLTLRRFHLHAFFVLFYTQHLHQKKAVGPMTLFALLDLVHFLTFVLYS